MAEPIEFYFEFSSPYGYIASQLVDAVSQRTGRPIRWRPFLLGPVFKLTGQAPLSEIPLKGEYSKRDFLRSAKYYGVPYEHPAKFPVGTVAGVRAFYWLHDGNPRQAEAFAKALYAAYFTKGIDIGTPEAVIEAAKSVGADIAALGSALVDPEVKDRAKREVDRAIGRGVFGSPFFIIDSEPFWGCDRIPMMEQWIAKGGW